MKKLSVKNKVGYAIGDFANTITFGMTSMFLLAYYTDVLGISAAAAGTLFLIARIWDAINDPMMGAICDKVFARCKGEKFRPYLLKGSFPVVIAAVLVFWAPDGLTDIQKLIWAYVTYILFGMAYTFVNIPYGSLASVMTNDPTDRAALSGARSFGGVFGTVSCNIAMPFLLSIYADDLGKAYLYGIMLLGSITLVGYLLAYRMTEEHIIHESVTENINFSIQDTLKTLSKNVPFLCVSMASMLLLTAMLGMGSVLYYYASLNLDGALWLITGSGLIQVGLIVLLAPNAGRMAARFGTKKLMLVGFAGAAFFSLISFLLPTSIYGALVYYVLGTPFMLLPNILIWANVADCIDYNYEISGQRQEGLIYSSYSFMRKMGQAIAGFIAGIGLSVVGYDAALEVQSVATLMGIKGFLFLMPAVLMAGCFLLYYFFWNLEPKKADTEVKSTDVDPQTI